MKKHRGAGHRGGRGNAGTGKRGDAKKPSVWAKKNFYGKHGFKRPQKAIKKINTANISFIESKFNALLDAGIITEKQGMFFIDMNKINVQKLLAKGSPARPYSITVDYASAKAIEKIKAAKGSITVSSDSALSGNTEESSKKKTIESASGKDNLKADAETKAEAAE